MASRVNTVLLCIVIALQLYSLLHRPPQIGRFQWLETPVKQLGFDTATGKRCWVWSDAGPTYEDLLREWFLPTAMGHLASAP